MRTMIKANESAFSNLSHALNFRFQIQVDKGKRWIKTDSEEKSWLQELKITDSINIFPSVAALSIEYQSDQYLILVGRKYEVDKIDASIFIETEINAGITTALISEGFLNLAENTIGLEFFDEIMVQDKDKGYAGHDYSELLPFLSPVTMFCIPESSILSKTPISRQLCYLFSQNENSIVLDFDVNVLKSIELIALNGSSKISFELVLNSLISTTYKHSFLEIYRLMERLFPVSYLKDFHNSSMTSLNFIEFTAKLEDVTSWRPKEEEAIQKIFDASNKTTLKFFEKMIASTPALQGQVSYKVFYKLRNSIVHYRANHEEFSLDRNQWNVLLYTTLLLVHEHYFSHETIL